MKNDKCRMRRYFLESNNTSTLCEFDDSDFKLDRKHFTFCFVFCVSNLNIPFLN